VKELRATYRLQLTPEFGFARVRELVPYLRDLGISHLYLSPSFQAREGSTHGYDVVEPRKVSDALGGEAELRALAAEGLGILLDIVPNHMAASDENPFWSDQELRKTFFDVDTRTGFHRRFFDIGELGGVRVEDEAVFATLHEKAFELVRTGVVDGLRIDHIVSHCSAIGCYFFDPEGNRTEVFWLTGRPCWVPALQPVDVENLTDDQIMAIVDEQWARMRHVRPGEVLEPAMAVPV